MTSLQKFTDQLCTENRPEEAAAFVSRMRTFCERLIELKKRTSRFETWQDVFIATEQSVNDIQIPVGDRTVEIAAKVDAIRFHPKYHLEVVDYKLSQGAQQKSDLVQLAIYAHLLPIWRPGCEFCGTLEYYSPDFMEVTLTKEELADIYKEIVAPVLLEMFAARAAERNVAQSSEAAGETKEEAKVVEAFKSFNLEVASDGIIRGPQIIRIKVRPAPGVKKASLANRAEDLQIHLSLDAPPLITAAQGYVAVDLPRSDRETMHLIPALDNGVIGAKASLMAFPVGVGISGEAIKSVLRPEHVPCPRRGRNGQRQERMAEGLDRQSRLLQSAGSLAVCAHRSQDLDLRQCEDERVSMATGRNRHRRCPCHLEGRGRRNGSEIRNAGQGRNPESG
jgi:FtsK alpha domain/PD-(D/E)XK nuclease superfamily